MKDPNPIFFLPRISLKDVGQIEDALSTVVLPAKICTDQVEDKFCPITCPQVSISLSGSTMSSTVQARSEKSRSQESTCSEKTVQDQLKINPQREEEKLSDGGEMFQSFQEDQREGNRTPEKLFLEHFTAEIVRDKILEDTTSYQEVITTSPSTSRKNGGIWK